MRINLKLKSFSFRVYSGETKYSRVDQAKFVENSL